MTKPQTVNNRFRAELPADVYPRYFRFDSTDFWEFYRSAEMRGIRFFLEGAKLAWSKRWLKKIAEWMVDLVIVFVGVYAAFVLNAYESRRAQSARREQLLTWLDDYCGESAANLENEQTLIEEALTDFNRRLYKGEMPELVQCLVSLFRKRVDLWRPPRLCEFS